MSRIPWYGHIPLCSSIHLLMNIWVVSTSLVTTCKVAMNIHIQIFVWTQDFFFLWHIPRHRKAGSYDICEYDFLDMAKLISKVAGDILHFYSQGYENSSSCTSLPVLCSVPQLCPLFCDSLDCSPPGSSIHRIFQARILEWVAISSFRDCPNQEIEPASPALAGRSLSLSYQTAFFYLACYAVFNIHPCCNMHQYILFYCLIILY